MACTNTPRMCIATARVPDPFRAVEGARSVIPYISPADWPRVATDARVTRTPLLIRGAFAPQAAAWSPRRFADRWPDLEVRATVDLPEHGVPYFESFHAHQETMTLVTLVEMLERGCRCYLHEMSFEFFPEIERDCDFAHLRLDNISAIKLWLGSRTRSGLHYDNADNMFAQMYGVKRVVLMSPRVSRFLYPFPDSPAKSQVDPEHPDLRRYPRFARCPVWTGDLEPGDALYIPRGWWHFIAADDVSISVNCWHGDSLTWGEHLRMWFSGGTPVIARTAFDFVRCGILGRPYQRRLFSAPPLGLQVYQFLASGLRKERQS